MSRLLPSRVPAYSPFTSSVSSPVIHHCPLFFATAPELSEVTVTFMNHTPVTKVLPGAAPPPLESESPARSFLNPSFTFTRTSTLGFAQRGAAVIRASRNQVRPFMGLYPPFRAVGWALERRRRNWDFSSERPDGQTYTPG